MADIAAFPTIRNVLVRGDNIGNYTAGAAIKAGQVVAIAATGVGETVHPAVAGTTYTPVGVALYDAASGAQVAVAEDGCVVYVAQADDTATIDAGHWVVDNDNAVGGTVSEMDPAIGAHSATVTNFYIGYLLTDMAASGTAKLKISIGPMETASS